MLLEAEDEARLEQLLKVLIELYAPERVYLFGSKARGDQHADSDFDLMVIVREDLDRRARSSRRAYEALWDLGTSADVLVWTRTQFDTRLHLRASLPATIVREGRLLYAA